MQSRRDWQIASRVPIGRRPRRGPTGWLISPGDRRLAAIDGSWMGLNLTLSFRAIAAGRSRLFTTHHRDRWSMAQLVVLLTHSYYIYK